MLSPEEAAKIVAQVNYELKDERLKISPEGNFVAKKGDEEITFETTRLIGEGNLDPKTFFLSFLDVP